MYGAMKKLIEKHFYTTANEAQQKIDVFFAVSRITNEEYVELAALINEVYKNDEVE